MDSETLIATTEINIRFSEMDPLGIVWHGNYVKYFEDGREAFGKKYNLGYMDFYNEGLLTPIVKMDFNFKKSLKYNEQAIVETIFVNSEAAKILYKYNIYRSSDKELVTTGSTMQVFLNKEGDLMLTIPPSFSKWKKEWGLE